MKSIFTDGVFRRALWFGLVIGSLLVLINQSGHLVSGDWSVSLLVRIALTYLTPFAVSMLSSRLQNRFWSEKTRRL